MKAFRAYRIYLGGEIEPDSTIAGITGARLVAKASSREAPGLRVEVRGVGPGVPPTEELVATYLGGHEMRDGA